MKIHLNLDLYLRWLTTENFKITKHSKVVVYDVKTSSRHKTRNKLRSLATDRNLNCYTLGVPSLMAK